MIASIPTPGSDGSDPKRIGLEFHDRKNEVFWFWILELVAIQKQIPPPFTAAGEFSPKQPTDPKYWLPDQEIFRALHAGKYWKRPKNLTLA